MKLNIKKVATVLGSALMLGATAGMAAAASFTPSSFGDGGVAIVVGANAANSDLKAAVDLTSNLAGDLAAQTATASASTVTGGDSYKFEKASVKLNVGDNLASTIKSTLTEDELPTLLAEGVFVDDDNDEFDYTQKIVMGTLLNVSMWEDNDYAEDAPTLGYRIPSGSVVLNYTLSFSETPLITDLPTTTLPIMGKSYYVLSNSSSGSNLILTLLDSATDATLNEGETTTLTVGDKSYEVSVSYISSSEVKLVVNGQTTNSIAELATYKLSDGSYVGVKDISYNAKDSGISSVEFSIGSGKLKLTSGSEIQVNDQAIPGLESVITNTSGAIGSSTIALSSIRFDWKADSDMFLAGTSQEVILPEFETVKLVYSGTTYPAEEIIEIAQGGDTYAVLDNFPLKDGPADIAFLYGAAGGPFSGIGKDASNKLVTSNTSTLTFDADSDEYFIVSYAGTTEGESYLMRATNFILDGTDNKTTIQYYKDGAWADKKENAKEANTFSIGNAELGVGAIDRAGKSVVITANSSSTNFYHLYSKEGLRTYLPFSTTVNNSADVGAINLLTGLQGNTSLGHNATSFYLNFSEEDRTGNIGSGDKFTVVVGWDSSTTPEVQVNDLQNNDVAEIEIGDTDVERSFMYSELATEFLYNKPTSGQDSIKIIYHGDEVVADTYITAPNTVVTPGSGGAVTSLGSVTVYDNEVSSVSGKNLIVIGGSCINSVAAELLGGAACDAAFTTKTGIKAGEALIQSFTRGTKVALLVAGFNAADTTKAVTYLSNKPIDTTVGKALKVTSATEATAITASLRCVKLTFDNRRKRIWR